MRVLTSRETCAVGGGNECTANDGNTYGTVSDTSTVGEELIELYEAAVAATSYIIERVADAL